MSKIVLGKVEIEKQTLAQCALTATGLGMIFIGIKKLIKARKLRLKAALPVDDEEEYEKFKSKREKKLRKKRIRKLRDGICGIIMGTSVAALGVLSFTPARDYAEKYAKDYAKQYIVDADLIGRAKNIIDKRSF